MTAWNGPAMPLHPLPPEDVFATRKKIEFVLRHLDALERGLGRPARILDFGCGNAEQLGKFVIGGGRTYVGVDFHRPSLDHARRICGVEGASFGELLPKGELFDAVLVSEVLEHLDDPAASLRELVPCLAPGGIVIGSVPNGYGLTEIEKFVIHRSGLYALARGVNRLLKRARGIPPTPPNTALDAPYNHESGHVQFFTRRSLGAVMAGAGLAFHAFQNGSVMGADLSEATVLRPAGLKDLNTRLADRLPHWAAATWHFAARAIRDPGPPPAEPATS